MFVPKISFCNDCDLMSWDGFRSIHQFLGDLRVPAGDSFWLFDPSGGDMGLFVSNCGEPGPRHEELLSEINAGRLDVIHSAGSYGARFSRGFRPDPNEIEKALRYLEKHARVPRIWTNHGDVNNIQNIGGALPNPHHQGDNPNSECYIIDALVDHGIQYFWLDRHLVRDAAHAYRVIAQEECRSGHKISVFARYMGDLEWSPNGQNFWKQLTRETFERLRSIEQNAIIYQHWGCDHTAERYAFTAEGFPLGEQTRRALSDLAEMHAAGEVQVVRLYDLLQVEAKKSFYSEASRIGKAHTVAHGVREDKCYYLQFHEHTLDYFRSRATFLGASGRRALDAGCGVGQWSIALREHFAEVRAFDFNEEAVCIGRKIFDGVRDEKLSIEQASVEQIPYPNETYDFVICYGVIFSVNIEKALSEIHRVLVPGGAAYLSVNGDGWYEYLVEDRLKSEQDSRRRSFVDPIWNAFVARCGGEGALLGRMRRKNLTGVPAQTQGKRDRLLKLLPDNCIQETAVTRLYSDYVVGVLNDKLAAFQERHAGFWAYPAEFLRQKIFAGQYGIRCCIESCVRMVRVVRGRIPGARTIGFPRGAARKLGRYLETVAAKHSNTDKSGVSLVNRAYLPDEFARYARNAGFDRFISGPEATITLRSPTAGASVRAIHEAEYRGKPKVWECILFKETTA